MLDIKNGKVFLEDMCKWVQSFFKPIFKNGHRLLVDGVWRSFTADSLIVHFFFEQLFSPSYCLEIEIFSCRFCPVEENFLCQFDEVSLRLWVFWSRHQSIIMPVRHFSFFLIIFLVWWRRVRRNILPLWSGKSNKI